MSFMLSVYRKKFSIKVREGGRLINDLQFIRELKNIYQIQNAITVNMPKCHLSKTQYL